MVKSSHSYEEQTRRLLAETRAELSTIEAQIVELEEKRATLKSEAQAFEIALQGYLVRTKRRENHEPNWVELLHRQKHKDRLITIAKHSDGKIMVSQATDLLYGKGFIRSKKYSNAYHITQILLSRMTQKGVFDRVTRGQYRLVVDNGQ